MGSDRARITYDEQQQYRAVVAQQGRVMLEADWNEAQQITNEEIRQEALDFVGATGTPDDGYKILQLQSETSPYDFVVKEGTMYVGGIRASLSEDLTYSKQKESNWLDYKGKDLGNEPEWVDPGPPDPKKPEFIYLYLREQEVSAVEDSALRDPALGGPDTTQRIHLIQRFVRIKVDESINECPQALSYMDELRWLEKGLMFNSQTMRLKSLNRLKVIIPSDQSQNSNQPLCEPEAAGGYLGAENQLIRIQISEPNKFVWGFDNASFLYRVTVGEDGQTLTLDLPPVDTSHWPRVGQAVEVLRSAAKLSNGEYIAAPTGIVDTLAEGYNSDNQTVKLKEKSVPAYYPDGKEKTDPNGKKKLSPRLFLRVWEKEESFEANKAVDLGTTGVQVILYTDTGKFHIGDYWQIGVRPGTPTTVYPERYRKAPQSPDGPRIWVCPLAIVQWQLVSGVPSTIGTPPLIPQFKLLADCRKFFKNLVELTELPRQQSFGCCTVRVKPEDIKPDQTLQDIIDRYQNQGPVRICLMPGTYHLQQPLRLDSRHNHLTLEGCNDGVKLKAAENFEREFLDGLIVVINTEHITLRRLQLEPPIVPFIASGGRFAGKNAEAMKEIIEMLRKRKKDIGICIGIRPAHCNHLVIEDCRIYFGKAQTLDIVILLGIGIFAAGKCLGLTLHRNHFTSDEEEPQRIGKQRYLFGYTLVPYVQQTSSKGEEYSADVLPSQLQKASFQDNEFIGLTFATFICAETGAVQIQGNTVRECHEGFLLLALHNIAPKAGEELVAALRNSLLGHLLSNLGISWLLLFIYPLPFDFLAEAESVVVSESIFSELGGVPQSFERLEEIQDFLGNFSLIEPLLRSLTIPQALLQLSLDFSRNTVDALVTKGPSGVALVVWDTDQETGSVVMVSNNRLHNLNSSLPTAAILMADSCIVTGNQIWNSVASDSCLSLVLLLNGEYKDLNSIVQQAKESITQVLSASTEQTRSDESDQPGQSNENSLNNPLVAITGNVFIGLPFLPPRPWPDPLNNWQVLNTIYPLEWTSQAVIP